MSELVKKAELRIEDDIEKTYELTVEVYMGKMCLYREVVSTIDDYTIDDGWLIIIKGGSVIMELDYAYYERIEINTSTGE